jgi:hypothetical protein
VRQRFRTPTRQRGDKLSKITTNNTDKSNSYLQNDEKPRVRHQSKRVVGQPPTIMSNGGNFLREGYASAIDAMFPFYHRRNVAFAKLKIYTLYIYIYSEGKLMSLQNGRNRVQ